MLSNIWKSNTLRALAAVFVGQLIALLGASTVDPISWKLVVVMLLVPVLTAVLRALNVGTSAGTTAIRRG